MVDGWRYLAQRIDGEGNLGEFLDTNLPLSGVNIQEVLSGHNGISGTITPEVQRLKGLDGRPILEEWATAIWAETPDGEIYGGIVETLGMDGPSLTVDCIDISGSMIDLPYTDAAYFVNVDPIDMFRHIWVWAQAKEGGNYGVSIDRTTSPIVLGGDLIQRVEFDTEPDPTEPAAPGAPVDEGTAETGPMPASPSRYATNGAWRDAGVKVMKTRGWNVDVVDDALRKWLNKDALKQAGNWTPMTERETTIKSKVLEAIGYPPNPPSGAGPSALPVMNIRPQVNPPQPTGTTTTAPEPDAVTGERIIWEYDAYKLNWYSNHDLSSDIDDLAAATPFDWHMTHHWFEDEIRHHIRIGYPRLGRRRDDLRFVIGENIKVVPSVERRGIDYANEVLVLGTGEGSAQVIGRAHRPRGGRPRRVATVSAPWITSNAMANNYAASQLASRNSVEDVSEIVVTNHSHAPIGSVDLGDEILLEGETGWADLDVWTRVLTRSFSPESGDSMVLGVMRTDRIL